MNSPPTIPGEPSATEDDPIIAGITILSSRNCGSSNRWEFIINRGEEEIAINALLDVLRKFDEFSLADHSRGDSESCATYRIDENGLKMMVGGHGWTGEWRNLEHEWAVYEVEKQVKYNYGPTLRNCGHLVKAK